MARSYPGLVSSLLFVPNDNMQMISTSVSTYKTTTKHPKAWFPSSAVRSSSLQKLPRVRLLDGAQQADENDNREICRTLILGFDFHESRSDNDEEQELKERHPVSFPYIGKRIVINPTFYEFCEIGL